MVNNSISPEEKGSTGKPRCLTWSVQCNDLPLKNKQKNKNKNSPDGAVHGCHGQKKTKMCSIDRFFFDLFNDIKGATSF